MKNYLLITLALCVLTVASLFTLPNISSAQNTTNQVEETPSLPETSDSDFENRYQTYLATYEQYRVKHAAYSKSRNSYLTYGTLQSQTNFLETLKDLISIRDDVFVTYIDMLALRSTDPIFNEILFQEKLFFLEHKTTIPALATVTDAQRNAAEVEGHYDIFESATRQVVAQLLLNKVERIEKQVAELEQNLNTLVLDIEKRGDDVAILNRWFIIAQNKLILAKQNMQDARMKMANLVNQSDYNNARFSLFSTNQYFEETLDLYNEVLQEIKYGNYTN